MCTTSERHLCVWSQRLESEKESLERDLSFKADQAKQYDSLLEAVRENNRQLQVGRAKQKPALPHPQGNVSMTLGFSSVVSHGTHRKQK